jgi:hypothetical protein
LILDVTEAEADKILATLDPLAAMADSDAVKLDALLRNVDTGSEALQQMLADTAAQAGLYTEQWDGKGVQDVDEIGEYDPDNETVSIRLNDVPVGQREAIVAAVDAAAAARPDRQDRNDGTASEAPTPRRKWRRLTPAVGVEHGKEEAIFLHLTDRQRIPRAKPPRGAVGGCMPSNERRQLASRSYAMVPSQPRAAASATSGLCRIMVAEVPLAGLAFISQLRRGSSAPG